MNKRFFLIITMVFILSACSTTNEKDVEKKWYDEYDVETNTITLAKLRTAANGEDYIENIVEVIDEVKLNQLKEGLKLELWEKVPREDELKEEPMDYMILNNETMIVLYSGYGHCKILNYKIEDGKYVKLNYSGTYIMNKDIFPIVKNFIEESNKATKSDG